MIEALRKTSKTFKWLLGVLFFLLLTVLITARYASYKIKPYVKSQLGVVVKRATNELYQIDFDKISTNLITGNAYLTNVEIKPDTNVYNQLVIEKKAPNNLYHIKLAKLSVEKVHPLKIFFKKVLDIDLILFDHPEITMINKTFAFNENKTALPEKSPYDYIKNIFKSLRVKTIDFREAKFRYVNNNLAKADVDSISKISITLKDWLIDANSATDTSRFYLLKDAHVYMNDYRFATPDSMYYIKASQFEFSASAKKINVKEFELQPRFSEADFAKVRGYAVDRYSLKMNNIQFSGVNLPAYIKTREVLAEQVTIAGGMLAVFNNNSYPKLLRDKSGRFPHQLLQRIKIPITLNKVILNKLDISYAEFDRKSKQRGSLSFNNTSGVIKNVTNQPKQKKKNPITEANLESYLMRQGKLTVNFKFDLEAPKADFSYNGQLLNLDGRQLNYVTKPLAMLLVKTCFIKRMAFNVKANEELATGNLTFEYSDLSLGIMKMHEGGQRLKRLGLLSLITNAMIIHSDNPSFGNEITAAPIVYRRLPTASFFNYIWQTLFQGIKYSVGFTPAKEAEIRSYVSGFEQIKSERERRRIRRDFRRVAKDAIETKN